MSKLQQIITRVNGQQHRINVYGNRLAACRKLVELVEAGRIDPEAYVWTDGATAIERDTAKLLASYITPAVEEAKLVKGVPYAILEDLYAALAGNVSTSVRQGPPSRKGAVCDPGYDLSWK